MTVLHVVAPGPVGGLEHVVIQLAVAQQQVGLDVHLAVVVTDGGTAHPFVRDAEAAGVVNCHVIASAPRAYLRERRTVQALARWLGADVIHTHGYRPDVLCASRDGLRASLVSTAHGFTGGDWKNRCYEWLQVRALRRYDAVVAVARTVGDRLARAGVAPSRLAVVPNAWRADEPALSRHDARRILGFPDDAFVVGWVGRLSFEKGPDVFLAALRRLADLPIAAAIVGAGPQRQVLERRARDMGLDRRVRWYGGLPHAARLFRGFDLFALSSRTEGTPIVLFEAMAVGTPVVATAVGGVPDVLTSEEAAIVPPGDAEALAAEVRAAFRDRSRATARAAAARYRLARDFAVPPWVSRYGDVYAGARAAARAG